MTFIRKFATVNLNAISSNLKLSLFKDFVWNNDLDFVFVQEVAVENFIYLSSHTALVNISVDGKGTGILIRKNIQYTNVILNKNGIITSAEKKPLQISWKVTLTRWYSAKTQPIGMILF